MPLCFAATPFGEIWCTGSGSPPLACEVHPCCAGIQEHPKATVGTSSGSLSAAANPTRADGALSAADTVWMPFIAAQEMEEMISKGHLAAEQPGAAAPVVHSFPYSGHHPHHHLCHMGRATQSCRAAGMFTGEIISTPNRKEAHTVGVGGGGFQNTTNRYSPLSNDTAALHIFCLPPRPGRRHSHLSPGGMDRG